MRCRTLVEVKRGSNPEIRRSIVGQLLEYAAHASNTWSVEEMREAFVSNAAARGRDPLVELATFLKSEDEQSEERFWEDVSTNLAAKRMRLLFIADAIPDPLARVAEFLNAQMPKIDVMAVEIKRFTGKTGQTLVPRVIGRTSATSVRNRSRSRMSHDTFLSRFCDEQAKKLAERLVSIAIEEGGEVYYGATGVSIRVRCSLWDTPLSIAWLYPEKDRGWNKTREFSFGCAVLDENELPESLRSLLESWSNEFAADDFTEDVSSLGVKAWMIVHEQAVEYEKILVSRLIRIIHETSVL